MKFLSENKALERLAATKARLREAVSQYEQEAKSCLTCDTPGACCLDVHFVNVHISRLEAVSITKTLDTLSDTHRVDVERRIENAIADHQLSERGDTFTQRYACPLFEPAVGCLVHHAGKPSPCIIHACYENSADLPPDELQQQAETAIDSLNTRTYGRPQRWLPIPLALREWPLLDR